MAQQRRRPNTMVYGNLAYDLDTLASQRQLAEAARPERQSQPQQAPRHRTAARPRQRVSPLALCAVGALAAMAVVLVMGYIQLTIISDEVVSLQNQLEELQTENVTLTAQHEQMFDMATVKEVAAAAGMAKPTSSQITYLDLDSEDSAVVYRTETPSVFSRILSSLHHGVYAVVEYFD